MSNYSAKQIENLRVAYSVMAGIPADKIDLDVYRNTGTGLNHERVPDKELIHTCGTTGCIAGWLSAHPHFKAQGLRVPLYDNVPTIGRMEPISKCDRAGGGARQSAWQ